MFKKTVAILREIQRMILNFVLDDRGSFNQPCLCQFLYLLLTITVSVAIYYDFFSFLQGISISCLQFLRCFHILFCFLSPWDIFLSYFQICAIIQLLCTQKYYQETTCLQTHSHFTSFTHPLSPSPTKCNLLRQKLNPSLTLYITRDDRESVYEVLFHSLRRSLSTPHALHWFGNSSPTLYMVSLCFLWIYLVLLLTKL